MKTLKSPLSLYALLLLSLFLMRGQLQQAAANSVRNEGIRLSEERSLGRTGGGEYDAAPPEEVMQADCADALHNVRREETAVCIKCACYYM